MQRTLCGALLIATVAMQTMTTAAAAQENAAAMQTPAPAAAAADAKRYTVTIGLELPTSYLFRGILQESRGVIAQPPIDLGVTLSDGVTLNVGQWHSIHSGPTGSFYESDYYGSMTFTAGKLKPGVLFTSYTSPNDRFATVQELAAFVSVDDSGAVFPLAPKATVAFELDGQADGGAARGAYLELAIRPSLTLVDAAVPLTLAMPARIGVSLKDYYESAGGSDRFGFVAAGLVASVPVTAGKVTWDFHGGADLHWLGRSTTRLNAGRSFKPLGTFGVTLTY